MADDKQSGSGLSGSVILLVIAVASAAYVGWRSPLVSTRPTGGDYDISQTKTAQDIDARLWQDPVGAVERAIEDKRSTKVDPAIGHCFDDFRNQVLGKSGSTLLLGVALPGDPYPEADETRRRLRYAVLSALHVSEYVPFDERHIGYLLTTEKPRPDSTMKSKMVASGFFRIAGQGGTGALADGGIILGNPEPTTNCVEKAEETGPSRPSVPAIIPFEGYEYAPEDENAAGPREKPATGPNVGKAARPKRIVVLWIDEEALSHGLAPIASLASLLCDLQLYKGDRFVFVGPQDSNELQDMVEEVKGYKSPGKNPLNKCAEKSQQLPSDQATDSSAAWAKTLPMKFPQAQQHRPLADDLTVYNFGATADESIILKKTGEKPSADPLSQLQQLFSGAGVRYYRTISTDEALAEVLDQELRRRGIDPCPDPAPNAAPPMPNAALSPGSPCGSHYDRVFLLSEWDTAYGRYLPESVSDAFRGDGWSFHGCRLDPLYGTVHASYLRGLDGELPSRRPAKDGSKPAIDETGEQTTSDEPRNPQTAATPETARRYETAEGQSQFDYLRRITDFSRTATTSSA
jgi:hypothetical protein